MKERCASLSPEMSALPFSARRQPARKAAGEAASDAAVLATATERAAALLGLNGAALARILGVSEATVSRVLRGEVFNDWELQAAAQAIGTIDMAVADPAEYLVPIDPMDDLQCESCQ